MKGFFRKTLCFILALFLASISPSSVFALENDKLYYYSQNAINFYDPDEGCYYRGTLRGDSIMEMVVDYLRGNNPTGFVLSDNGIAGVLASFQGESAFNPFRFEGNRNKGPGYGYGIAQFTPMGKILDPLRSDPRTANYFNEYFDEKYNAFDEETGFPLEPMPREVIEAWLSVQLDFFFSAGSEFETTRVGSFRDLGGDMGLSYISDDMTAHEAMDAAQSPEHAARIFVWIMERPADKEGASQRRADFAQHWYNFAQSVSFSTSGGSIRNELDGSDVTIIGDSLTAMSADKILEKLPKADIRAQEGKQFYNGSSSNPGGITILRELANSSSLRDIVVYALGTSDSSVTEEQVKEVVQVVGSSRKLIFVTNYSESNDYIGNNNNFVKASNDNTNVSIADWKAAVSSDISKYLSANGIYPTSEGQDLFATMVYNAVGEVSEAKSICGLGALSGGLSEAQAQRIADFYNSSAIGNEYLSLDDKGNCVSFSKFFVTYFTGKPWISGDGRDVAHNLAVQYGLEEGNAQRPYAVFSITDGVTMCGDHVCGHTGIVVGVDGDDLLTIESWHGSSFSGAFVEHHNISYFVNDVYGYSFTYIADLIEASGKIGEFR